MKKLETDRLTLRLFTLEDLDDFYQYCQLKTVGPNAGWKPHIDKEESKCILKQFIEKANVYAVVYKDENKVIGSIGLHKKIDLEGNIHTEIGYVLSTPYEGKGLMTEAVKRVLNYAFLELKLDNIMVCHFIENDKSKRVIEKCGFTFTSIGPYQTLNYGVRKSKYYSLKRDDYIKLLED